MAVIEDVMVARGDSATHPTPGGWSLWRVVSLYGLVIALLAIPIFSVQAPPLCDYLNHMARMHVLATYANNQPLQANYLVRWQPSPYIGMDLVVPLLAKILPFYSAGQVFLLIIFATIVLGSAAIQVALHGHLSPWPAAAALLVYNLVLSLGVVNYLFGVGVWLLAFAAWIALSRRAIAWRLVGGVGLSLAVYFTHFFAFGGYMLCVGAYELGVWLTGPRKGVVDLILREAIALTPFVPSLGLLALTSLGQPPGDTVYGSAWEKLAVVISPVAFPGATIAAPLLGLMVVPGLLRGLFGRVRVAPQMIPPLIALSLAAVATPSILRGIAFADWRLPVVVLWLLISACQWRDVPKPSAVLAVGMLLALLLMNMVAITLAWAPVGRQFDAFRAGVSVIPRGARVLAFEDTGYANSGFLLGSWTDYVHLPALVVVERDAFLPFLFKNPMMTVQSAPRLREIDTPTGVPISLSELIAGADPVKGPAMLGSFNGVQTRNYWGGWPENFDYAVELSFGAHPALPPQLHLVKAGGFFNIYRVVPR